MIDPKLHEYQPSGKFSFSVFGLLIAYSLLATLFAFLYALVSSQVSFDLVKLITFLAFVSLNCFIVSKIVHKGKIRNAALSFIFGLFIGFITLLFSWRFLNGFVSENDFGLSKVLLNAVTDWSYIFFSSQSVEVAGYFQLLEMSLNENLVYTLWIVEAVLLIVLPGLYGFYLVNRKAFCETCEDWLAPEGALLAFYYNDLERLKREFKLGSLGFLEEAKGIFHQPDHDYFLLQSELCESCNDFFTLQIKHAEKESDLDKPKIKTITPKMIATRPHYQHFSLRKAEFPVPEESE